MFSYFCLACTFSASYLVDFTVDKTPVAPFTNMV